MSEFVITTGLEITTYKNGALAIVHHYVTQEEFRREDAEEELDDRAEKSLPYACTPDQARYLRDKLTDILDKFDAQQSPEPTA